MWRSPLEKLLYLPQVIKHLPNFKLHLTHKSLIPMIYSRFFQNLLQNYSLDIKNKNFSQKQIVDC